MSSKYGASKFSEEECVAAMEQAYDLLGESPTIVEYRELGLKPSSETIKKWVGWNEAKRRVGIEEYYPDGRNCRLPVDTSYFETLDRESAYWLGFIYADGCVHSFKDWATIRLSISLTEGDRGHLEHFRDCVGSKHSINTTPRLTPSDVVDELSTRIAECDTKDQVQIAIGHPDFVAPLEDYGLSAESEKDTIPAVADHIPDFIRGYFDGDGTCGIYKNTVGNSTSYSWGISCSKKERLHWMEDHLNRMGVSHFNMNQNDVGVWQLATSKRKNVKKLHELLWNGNSEDVTCLRRKGEIMDEVGRRVK